MYSPFSTPYDGDFRSLAGRLSCHSFARILDKANSRANEHGLSASCLDPEILTPERMSTRCWRPELGAATLGLARDRFPAGIQWVIAQLQLAAFLGGGIEELHLDMVGTHPISVAGHFLQNEWLSFDGDGDQLTASDREGKLVLELHSLGSIGKSSVWARNPDEVVRDGNGGMVVLNPNLCIEHWLPKEVSRPRSQSPQADKAQYEEALGYLYQGAPEYHHWVTSLLQEMAFLESIERGTVSGSCLAYPGYIQASSWTPVTSIIVLVHECSHQYFNLLLWHAPVTLRDAPEAWSILKKTTRKLDRILIGFHAFGNVLLALGQLLSANTGLSKEDLQGKIDWHLELVLALDKELFPLSERYLTDPGKAIYQPLRNRLLAADFLPGSRFLTTTT